jgi:hypothetical protein
MPWEKSSADLVDLFHHLAPSGPQIEKRKLFGCLCAFLNGNMFFGLFQQSMLFRLPPADLAAFLDQPGTAYFEPLAGCKSKHTVVCNDPFAFTEAELADWVQCALHHAAQLPPKIKKAKKCTAKKKAARR